MNTHHPAGILILGLLLTQLLAAIQVYLSNIDLYSTLSAVKTAGYLTIPNATVMKSLREFRPAFLGGLFFTFSIGAGLSLGSMAAAWLWVSVFLRNKLVLYIFLAAWGGLLLSINIDGFNSIPTLYFLFIPPVLFVLMVKRKSREDIHTSRIRRWVHVLPIPLLALLWFTQYDKEMFLDLRDNLLLSNLVGTKFSNFYYTYTLYPAEAFKSLDQKIIKTCKVKDVPNHSIQLKLEKRLIANDYLLLADASQVDLSIIQNKGNLVFEADGHRVFEVKQDQFLSDSRRVLQKFSRATDRHATFRHLTFLSLLIGFPVLIYMLAHAGLYYLFFLFLHPKTAALTASIMCLLIGTLVLFYFQAHRSSNIKIANIPASLISEKWQTRVAALKIIHQKRLEIATYRAYPQVLKSRVPQERYWFARSLSVSRRPDTYNDLLFLLKDPNTNVRTMAYYSLGRRKNPQAIGPILESIETANDWYTQMYAYNALRSLGWKQKKLP
ncbi:MAG: HEAT repeat domain-containing protein [Desulfobacterales bacterium]|nr:HEAT repeat domain-containing protein [Desulfobacterales bacterium]